MINFHGEVVSKKYTTLFYFAIGGLIGPLVWAVSKNLGMAVAVDYTIAMLWPTWSLATFEYSLGQPWAGLIAVVANMLLFVLIGVFSLLAPSGVWRVISFASVCAALIWLNYWLNGWDILSLLVAVAVVAVLYCMTGRQACQRVGSRKALDRGR